MAEGNINAAAILRGKSEQDVYRALPQLMADLQAQYPRVISVEDMQKLRIHLHLNRIAADAVKGLPPRDIIEKFDDSLYMLMSGIKSVQPRNADEIYLQQRQECLLQLTDVQDRVADVARLPSKNIHHNLPDLLQALADGGEELVGRKSTRQYFQYLMVLANRIKAEAAANKAGGKPSQEAVDMFCGVAKVMRQVELASYMKPLSDYITTGIDPVLVRRQAILEALGTNQAAKKFLLPYEPKLDKPGITLESVIRVQTKLHRLEIEIENAGGVPGPLAQAALPDVEPAGRTDISQQLVAGDAYRQLPDVLAKLGAHNANLLNNNAGMKAQFQLLQNVAEQIRNEATQFGGKPTAAALQEFNRSRQHLVDNYIVPQEGIVVEGLIRQRHTIAAAAQVEKTDSPEPLKTVGFMEAIGAAIQPIVHLEKELLYIQQMLDKAPIYSPAPRLPVQTVTTNTAPLTTPKTTATNAPSVKAVRTAQ